MFLVVLHLRQDGGDCFTSRPGIGSCGEDDSEWRSELGTCMRLGLLQEDRLGIGFRFALLLLCLCFALLESMLRDDLVYK